jgi:sporulation protein YlmC with PRC-barrel domain
MTIKVSQLIGLDIYTDSAQYVGKVYDVILDLEKGEIVRLTMQPINAASKDQAAKIFKEKTILYKSVKAVEKIIIVSPNSNIEEEVEEPARPEPSKPMPYSYRYRKV